ncbi:MULTISPECIES: MoxR family ATPase [Desulfitobacterium]|uniref:ATPase family protein associated with various cellular activities (AAA) n=1 Tax=Desulfitobacterium dehalogenans (strain ATCC 51507 / DSM 9161 / JW/IU-DC1) TaxID=756499 RepID=I4A9C9_DESDJ|nr:MULTISPECIES: MoxR family ATPase [Desulfitobacterium]AFM00564.1 ATPase family protein associated with various cellular activities (AAA) [Desulfitobacterium dehalogenans ATCC 51507]
MWGSPLELMNALEQEGYILNQDKGTTLFLALALRKPCLIEGPAGVGKTQLALALARSTGRRLIRLQCYEGLDLNKALYEWDYAKQLLRLQVGITGWEEIKENIYGPEFLLARPLLQTVLAEEPVILLIDELDKSDEEFESFLLELLAEFQVTIPEVGTFKAKNSPMVLLTSNNTRDLSEALRRRCVHLLLAYPDVEQEMRILAQRCPEITTALIQDVCEFVAKIRKIPLRKLPSVSESMDFARALHILRQESLDMKQLEGTLSILLKYPSDLAKLEERLKAWQQEAARRTQTQSGGYS